MFSKIERYFGFPHDSNYLATKRKVCLGPGTEIQGAGKLFWRKIGPPICSRICWDVFADFGGGGGVVGCTKAKSIQQGIGPGQLVGDLSDVITAVIQMHVERRWRTGRRGAQNHHFGKNDLMELLMFVSSNLKVTPFTKLQSVLTPWTNIGANRHLVQRVHIVQHQILIR